MNPYTEKLVRFLPDRTCCRLFSFKKCFGYYSKMVTVQLYPSPHLTFLPLNSFPKRGNLQSSILGPSKIKVPVLRESNNGRNSRVVKALNDVSSTGGLADPSQAQVTWQIIIGALAGVTPFVVAGIEFSKRIVAQQQCTVCKGSGLVLRDNKYYFRCPRCGGFLPWQSWKRFFSG